MRRCRCGAVAGLVVAVVLGGCGRRPERVAGERSGTTGPQPGGQVVVAVYADVQSLNPYQASGEALEAAIIDMQFPTLMAEQPDYQLHPPSFSPRLASSWEFSQDNRTVTFHLREDASWSDGIPITAEDVRFTFEVQRSRAIDWPDLDIKDFIDDIEVVDTHTVRFHYSRVYPYQLMDANDGPIVPAHAWGKVPLAAWHTTDFEPLLLSGGPFAFASHSPEQTLVLDRNPTYWDSPEPHLQRLIFRVIPDTSSQINQLLSGAVQLVPMLPPREAERVRRESEVELVEFPSRAWVFVAWNNQRSPFSDRRVRRALSLAINRKSAVDTAYHGFAKLANGPILSTMWAYNEALPVLEFDPVRAAELLAEVGWVDGDGDGVLDNGGQPFEFALGYPSTNTVREELALLIQADLARIGIRCRPSPVEPYALFAQQEAGDFDAVLAGWEEPTKIDLTSTWATPSADQGGHNFFRYSNPEVDRLIAAARDEPDYTRAKVIYDRLQELIVGDQPVTPMYEATQLVGIRRQLHGADINSASVFFNVEEWYWGQ